jgi:peptide deformylase
MSIIKLYGNDILRQKCEDVVFPDEILNQTILSMFLVMHKASGVGLAANQVGINKRIAVINIDPEMKDEERVILINPRIISSEGEQEMEEGCLSLPGFACPCKRAAKITVESHDVEGNKYTFEADDLLAVAIQHEIGHLDAKLFIDELSTIQKMLIEPRLKKFLREHKHDNK